MRWIVVTLLASGLLVTAPLAAQTTRDTRSNREAYGARLTPSGPSHIFSTKVNGRLDIRINSRISTRIERYRVGDAADPAAAFAVAESQLAKQITPVQSVPQAESDER